MINYYPLRNQEQEVVCFLNKMAKKKRNVRDGTGPYEGSYRRRVEGKTVGRRLASGEICPVGIKKTNIW